jgi:trimeric autotransporter adhesin
MFTLSIHTHYQLSFSMKRLFLLLFATVSTGVLLAQTDVKVGTTPGSISPSAVFEAASTTKGLLIPRVTTAQMNAIAAPALGLMVFNTDLNCLHFYFGGWKSQCDPSNLGAWSLLGNNNTTAATHFIGTTNAQDLVFKANNTEGLRLKTNGLVGIGTNAPAYKLDIDAMTGAAGNPLRLKGLNGGSITDSILSSNNGVIRRLSIADIVAAGSNAWGLTGNGGTNPSTNYIGTTDNIGLSLRTNNVEKVRITEGGNVGIGISTPLYKLDIDAMTGLAGNPLRLLGLNAGATADSIVTSNAGILRRLSITEVVGASGWLLNGNTLTGTTTIGSNSAHDVGIETNGTTRLTFSSTGAITQTGANQVTFTGNVAATNGLDVTTAPLTANAGSTLTGTTNINTTGATATNIGNSGSATTVLGATTINTTGTAATSIGNSASTVTVAGTTGVTGATTINTTGTAATTIGNAASNVTVAGTTSVTGATSINTNGASTTNIGTATSTGTVTVGNISNTVNIASDDVQMTNLPTNTTVDNFLTINASNQIEKRTMPNILTGTGVATRVAFWGTTNTLSSNANLYWDNTNSRLGIGTGTPQYKMDIDAMTGAAGNPLRLLGLNAGATADSIVTSNAGILRRLSITEVVGASGWLLNGNTLTGTTTIGSNSAHDVGIETNGTTRLTFSSTGAITQTGANQVTFTGNVAATNGLDVTTALLTANAGSTLTGTTNINTTGATATNIGNSGSATTVLGATTINTTGTATTTIGNAASNVNVAGTTGVTGATTINTTGTATTTIGNAASNVNVAGTTGVTGATTINTTGTAATTIGNAASNVTVAGTTSVTGATSINTSGASTTNIGTATSTGTVTVGNTSNTVNIASDDVQMTNLPTNTTVDNFLTINASNQIEKRTMPNIITGTGVATRVAFWGTTNTLSSNANLYWDNTNSRLGIGTGTPQYKLDIDAMTGAAGNPVRFQGLNAGAATDSILTSLNGVVRRFSMNSMAWALTGNSGTTPGTNFLGTTDLQDLVFKTNGVEGMRLSSAGKLGIGTNSPFAKITIFNSSTDDTEDDVLIRTFTNGTNQPAVVYQKARGTSAAPLSLGNSELIGGTFAYAYNGSAYVRASAVQSYTSPTFATDRGSDLLFYTAKNDALIEAAKLTATGNFGVNVSTPLYKIDVDAMLGSAGNPLRLLGLNAGAATDSVLTSAAGVVRRQSVAEITANDWHITGNNNVLDNATYYLGTSNNIPLNFRVNGQKAGRVGLSGETYLGYQAGNATTAADNTFIGSQAGTSNTLGDSNVGLGTQAMQNNTTGTYSVAIGYQALQAQSFSNGGASWVAHNVAVGNRALWKNQPTSTGNGIYNTAIGNHTLYNNTTGAYNTAIGNSALFNNTTASNNVGVGYYALNANTTGYQNVALGVNALAANTTGYANTGHGHQTLSANTTGYENSAFGNSALLQNTVGFQNTANGTFAMRNNTIGSFNTSIGNSSLYNNTTSNRNVAIGYEALTTQSFSNAGVSYNTDNIAIGHQALRANQPTASFNGSQNVAIGTSALTANTIGYQNVAVGTLSMANNTDGFANTAQGQQTLQNNTTGNQNSAFGAAALINNTTGVNNTGSGANTMRFNTIGSFNSTLGTYALQSNTTASRNVAIGYDALQTQSFNNGGVTWNSDNVAIGYQALSLNQPTTNTNGRFNTAIGTSSLGVNTIGTNNTAVGAATLQANTTGNQNLALGQAALATNVSGSSNTAVGQSSLFTNAGGTNNTAIGTAALYFNTASNNVAVGGSLYNNTTGANNTATGTSAMNNFQTGSNNVANGYGALGGSGTLASNTGSNNTAIGYESMAVLSSGGNNAALGFRAGLANQVGSNNTFLGYQADATLTNLTNATAIGNGATVDASNKMRLGNTSVTLVETYGTFVTVSDKRLKTNISDNAIGLNFIKAVRPVKYELIAQKGMMYDGFIAQEIDSILQKQNIKTFSGLSKPKNDSEHYSVSYSTFVVPLVNAVKELDEKNTQLATENEQLKAELAKMKAANSTLKASVEKNSQDIETIKAMLDKKQ